jgi:hypothetical protein
MTHEYKQVKEMNFNEIFVIIIKSMFYKSLIVISTNNELQIRYMNVVTIFLYDFLKKEIYINQSENYEINVDTIIYKLIKTLYNLKQTLKI